MRYNHNKLYNSSNSSDISSMSHWLVIKTVFLVQSKKFSMYVMMIAVIMLQYFSLQ